MILKQEFYGVKGCLLNCLKSYLHNRKQKTILHFVSSPNLLSDWEIVRIGFPQGSILGPLLFNVYVNDFPCIINKVSLTILLSSGDCNELNSKLNLVLCCISKWFQNNQLVLNLNKTHIVKFAFYKLLTYPLNTAYNIQYLITENIEFLGMHLDCNLTWKSHIDNLINKIEFDLLHVEEIIIYCKCKNVTYGLLCTFLFTNQLWYNFLGPIFINEKCGCNSKDSN